MRYVDLGKLPHRGEKKSKRKKIIKFASLALVLGIILYGSYVLYWPISTLVGQIIKQPKSVLSLIQNPKGELKSTNGRTNFLLVGIDKRANVPYSYKGPDGTVQKNGFLTDTIEIVSVDRTTKKVAMISIPRDTWVSIPAFGNIKGSYGKINSLYSIGNIYNYPSGSGMGLLEKKIEDILGIKIDYGVRIDFDGFRKGIDLLGGVDIIVDNTFDDYQYPVDGKDDANCSNGTYSCRYEHLHFDKGSTHLNGTQALKFVRSRHAYGPEGSDFARAKRQQKVLLAAKEKALKIQNIFDPIKINNLFTDFGQSIETNLDVSALVGVYNLAKEIKIDQIGTLVLNDSTGSYLYSPPMDQYGGAYVLIPKGNDWSKVQKAVQDLLNPAQTGTTAPKQ